MNYPKVAIIILNYNGWKDTIECLESVLRNNYPSYQVIVVDNGSQDNSIEYIKAWAEGKQKVLTPEPGHPLYNLSHPPVKKPIPYIYYTREEAEKGGDFELEEKLTKEWKKQRKSNNKELIPTSPYPLIFIQTGENLGFAGGNNVGMKYALAKNDGEYIWLLNNDIVIKKNSLLEMIKVFQMKKSIGVVGSKILRYYTANILQVLCGTKKLTWKNAGEGKYLYPNRLINEVKCNDMFEINGYIVGASMLIKKKVLHDIGLFDENYFMWAEEADFCFRALKNNWNLFCACNSVVYHKEGGSTGKDSVKKFFKKKSKRPSYTRFIITGYLDIRNHLYFVRKHFSIVYMYLYFIILLPKLFRRVIGIVLFDDFKLKRISLLCKGIIDGFLNRMGKPKELKRWIKRKARKSKGLIK